MRPRPETATWSLWTIVAAVMRKRLRWMKRVNGNKLARKADGLFEMAVVLPW
jgi:hypothetical protein